MELGTRARRAALGCCVALIAAGSTTSPTSAAPPPETIPLPPGLIEAVQRDLGIDAHEYLQRTATAQRLAEFASTARYAHPAAFAGIRMQAGKPIVSLTEGISTAHARAAAEKAGFTVETVADNEATLQSRRTSFERWLAAQPSTVIDSVLGYGIDPEHNDVAVRLSNGMTLPAEAGPVRAVTTVIPEAHPDDSLPVGTAIAEDPTTEGTEPADVIGGQPYAIELAGKKHKCSFGFNATDAQGNTVNITAGHCDPNNLVAPAAKSVDPQRIFEVKGADAAEELGFFQFSNLGPNDYSILQISKKAAPRFQNNLISTDLIAPAAPPPPAMGSGNLGSSNPPPAMGSSNGIPPIPAGSSGDRSPAAAPKTEKKQNVLQIDGTTEPIVGENVCKSGFKSGFSCGQVIAVGQKGMLRGIPGRDDQIIKVENMFFTDVCAQRGDSGGPIFSGTKAVGINSAIITMQTPLDANCGHLPILLGQPISNVLKDNPGLTIHTK